MAVASLPALLAIKGSARREIERPVNGPGQSCEKLSNSDHWSQISQFFYKTYLCELVLGFLPDWNQTSAEIFSGEGKSIIVKKVELLTHGCKRVPKCS